jgi:2-methylcitrate dehydratase PrpD
MQDPSVLRLRAKVQLIPDEELERRMPQREGTVDILMDDGRRITEHVAAVRGTFSNPMPREEVISKARDLMSPVVGGGQTTKLIDGIMALENLKNIRDLRPLLQRG